MKKAIYILIVLFLTAGLGCKKEMRKTTINGIIRDFITKNNLDGVEVYLQAYTFNDVSYNIQKTVASCITGTDGKFKFEFKPEKEFEYGLEYQKPSQCYFDYDSPIRQFVMGEESNLDIKLHSSTTLYIHIKNTSPFDVNDHICYVFDKNGAGCLSPGYYGMTTDVLKNISVDAYEKVYIKSFITKNSILTTRLDSVTIAPCTPQTFDLFY